MTESRIEETLNALNGMSRAAPRDGLFDNVMLRINNLSKSYERVEPVKVWMAAASFAALLALNIGVISSLNKPSKQTVARSLANDYGLTTDADNLYNY